ncbi:MAG: hypothetical protein QME66_12125 [Candidatus Eisenbacteria bacterium]|nr:hypothetical protein [Candidatus Eisenbacteria bacterium]
MKKYLVLTLVLVLLVLDWAALHDILKGESDSRAEVAVLAVSAILLAAIAVPSWKRLGQKSRSGR